MLPNKKRIFTNPLTKIAVGAKLMSLCDGRVAQWQSSGLLSRLLRVRVPPRSQTFTLLQHEEGIFFIYGFSLLDGGAYG